MLVAHALWDHGRVCFWAEDATRPERGSSRRGRDPRPHPFAAPAEALRALLNQAGDGEAEEVALSLVLPSLSTAPLPSPELVRPVEPRPSRATPRLASWTVPALGVEVPAAVGLLRESPPETAGGSLRWLAGVAAFAEDLVHRGRVLPSLRDDRARWLPYLAGADAERARALVRAVPPVVRARHPAGRTGAEVLAEVLAAFVDAEARRALVGRKVVPSSRRSAPVAQRWVRALAMADPRVDATLDELSELDAEVRRWHASAPPAGPLRTFFRLALPPGDAVGLPWRVEFLLQANDDPSLTVDAGQVWRRTGAARVLARYAEHPEEELLAGLGRASRIYPELDTALGDAQPVALELVPDQAHQFLRQAAPALAQAGFGVQLPTQLRTPPTVGLRLRATSSTPSSPAVVTSSRLGLDQVLMYRWELSVGGESLTDEELTELAAAKAPLVRLRGQWVELDPARLRRALDFLERSGTGVMTARDMLQADAVLAAEGVDVPVDGVTADGWLGDVLTGRLERRLEPVMPPGDFFATLRPYQQRGLAWLVFLSRLGLGGCLADDMGLGKTVQLLALLATERADERPGPTLLVCPMSVVGNWQREAARFAPGLRVYVHHGADRLDGDELAAAVAQADLVVTTYGLVARQLPALSAIDWHRVVLDEAQNIKNAGAKQSRAVRALSARHRVALTGTPVENRLAELWSVMEFANPGLLGPAKTFRDRFAVPIERDRDLDVAAALRRRTQPFVLRRVKTDQDIIADLPDKIEMRMLCNLTAEQASLYQAVVTDMLDRISGSEGIERRGLVLSALARLKQVCNHPAHLLGDGSRMPGRSGKVARLEEILEEALSEGDKALCFTQFAEFGGMLRAHLTSRFGQEVLFLHGGDTKRRRDAMVDRFQSADGPAVFVLSLKAGGVGLNLTAANHVIHVDRWWNPAVEDQATDRAFRIGQRRTVQVRKFVCAGTVEERIDAMIEQKKALASMVVGSGEDWLTDLSTTRLRDLFALSPDAVAE